MPMLTLGGCKACHHYRRHRHPLVVVAAQWECRWVRLQQQVTAVAVVAGGGHVLRGISRADVCEDAPGRARPEQVKPADTAFDS